MASLRDESINTERMILSHDLIKISVGRQGVTQFLMLVLPKLKGLEFKLLVMVIRVTQISLRGEEGVLLRGVILKRRRSFCEFVSITNESGHRCRVWTGHICRIWDLMEWLS